MELKHGQMNKPKPETTEKPGSSLRRCAAAGVLAAGLAFLPSIAGAQTGYTEMKKTTGSKSYPAQAVPERYTEMKKIAKAKLDCNNPSVSLICVAKKSVLKEGDSILFIEFLNEKAGFFEVKAGKIDDQGVDIKMSMELSMSEHATNDKMPMKILYGEAKGVPDVGIDPLFNVAVEKGDTPGTARITITPYGEKKGVDLKPPAKADAEPKDVLCPLLETSCIRGYVSRYHGPGTSGYTELSKTAKAKPVLDEKKVKVGDTLFWFGITAKNVKQIKVNSIDADGANLSDGTHVPFERPTYFGGFVLTLHNYSVKQACNDTVISAEIKRSADAVVFHK